MCSAITYVLQLRHQILVRIQNYHRVGHGFLRSPFVEHVSQRFLWCVLLFFGLLLFLAGTIGNLHPDDLPSFFGAAAAVLEPGDGFLVGVDLVKDEARLHAAYNDSAGVTAQFNLNILRVLDDRLGADFDPADFEHVAFYDAERRWIEMRLRARRRVRARIPRAGLTLDLQAGGEIRTELSCKYTRESFASRLGLSGLVVERWITDPEGLFASALLRRA